MRSYSKAWGTICNLLGYTMMEDNMRKRMRMYVWLGHFTIQLKLAHTVNKLSLKTTKNVRKKECTHVYVTGSPFCIVEKNNVWGNKK